MRTLNAVVMVIFVRLAVGYLFIHLVVERLTAYFHQIALLLDGW